MHVLCLLHWQAGSSPLAHLGSPLSCDRDLILSSARWPQGWRVTDWVSEGPGTTQSVSHVGKDVFSFSQVLRFIASP